MNLQAIKAAISDDQIVHWKNSSYTVKLDQSSRYVIVCTNGSTIGLTWNDGVTLNGKEADFYVSINSHACQVKVNQ